ncbi:MAG: hypothetical protein QGG40_20970, partial [Myxococcota bacterium]|nr:hypothetical protein [Myxococcota bacterium]
MAGAAGDLASSGYWGDDAAQELETDQSPDLTDFVSPDMITDMLGSYIREVRVLVWWGDEPEDEDQIELVTHVINPSGTIVAGTEETTEEE